MSAVVYLALWVFLRVAAWDFFALFPAIYSRRQRSRQSSPSLVHFSHPDSPFAHKRTKFIAAGRFSPRFLPRRAAGPQSSGEPSRMGNLFEVGLCHLDQHFGNRLIKTPRVVKRGVPRQGAKPAHTMHALSPLMSLWIEEGEVRLRLGVGRQCQQLIKDSAHSTWFTRLLSASEGIWRRAEMGGSGQ